MAGERSSRKMTPVQVVYFPKKTTRTLARITQTIPEVPLPAALGDEPEPAAASSPGRGKGRAGGRRKAGVVEAQVTLSDEVPAGGVDGVSELAVLGHTLFTQGRIPEAKVIFEGLVVGDATDGFARTMLGTISLALQDFERAMALFEEALAIDPGDVSALVYRGELRLERRKVRLGLCDLERALELAEQGDPFAERAARLLKGARRSERR